MIAGQIFIPKMPSMKVIDLAKTMAGVEGFREEEVEFKEIGIRPGEKLHECLLTKEESSKCIIEKDHYLIHRVEQIPQQRFTYTSDKNDWILGGEELIKMIEE